MPRPYFLDPLPPRGYVARDLQSAKIHGRTRCVPTVIVNCSKSRCAVSPLFKGSPRYCGGGVQNLSKMFIPNPSATLVPLQRGHLRAGVGSVCYFFCVVDHLLGSGTPRPYNYKTPLTQKQKERTPKSSLLHSIIR